MKQAETRKRGTAVTAENGIGGGAGSVGVPREVLMPFAGRFRVASPYGLRTDPVTGEEKS